MTLRTKQNTPHDVPTLIAIAICVCAFTNLLHEAAGHGTACLLMGVKPLGLSSIRLDWDYHHASEPAWRVIAAAGTLLNLLVALLVNRWLVRRPPVSPAVHYFLWLLMSMNLLLGASYLFFTFAPFADWYWFTAGLSHRLVWQIGLPFVGLVLYLPVGAAVIGRGLRPFLPPDAPSVAAQARLLTWLPYIVCGVVAFAAAVLYRYGNVAGMAIGQWFGGASLLFYLPFFVKPSKEHTEAPGRVVARDGRWILTGAVVLLLFVFVLGPGIRFR